MNTIDVGSALDDADWSRYQKLLVFATAMTIILDGLDNQLLGAALPALMREWSLPRPAYVPRRQRPFAVTLTIVCIPVGGSLAGFVGGQILPRFGWRGLFLVGGILPLVMAAVLLKVLPESPRYLARLPERWPQLRTLLR